MNFSQPPLPTARRDGRLARVWSAVQSLAPWFPLVARIAIFLVYTWFGLVKLTGLSGATPLAEELTRQTIGMEYFGLAFTLLAVIECIIGLLFVIPSTVRVAVVLMLGHLAVVCSPLVLVPHAAWIAPLVPNLEGQYIIKNVLLLALALGISTASWPSARRGAHALTRPAAGPGPDPDRTVPAGVVSDDKVSGTVRR
ncbi:hypothetical protein [Pseudonocardia sp. TRM90224]|uniref:hypothetical protein n=1 Tax=Pseudonocardia sp. TRM90224 TaxID=2812678 RepID=UPI001E61AD03|nr:hypothetical protein [Pseudonocardia sp. TRM90224]